MSHINPKSIDDDLYSSLSIVRPPPEVMSLYISTLTLDSELIVRSWATRLRPINGCCHSTTNGIVEALTHTTCRITPPSNIRLWENGTFTFHPHHIQENPCVYLGLEERIVGNNFGDVDLLLGGFDLKQPFTIYQKRQEYVIKQHKYSIVMSRSGMINGQERFERQEVPLSMSFSGISFDVSFAQSNI
jgi:hypothetical protein